MLVMINHDNKGPVGFRLDAALIKRLRLATIDSKNPYSPNMTKVVERGIELALRELEKK